MKREWLFLLGCLLLLLGVTNVAATELKPRTPSTKSFLETAAPNAKAQRVIVKFHEGTHVRLRNGVFTVSARTERSRRDLASNGLTPRQVDHDVEAALLRMDSEPRVTAVAPLFGRAETLLNELRERGEARGRRVLADLNLYYRLTVEEGSRVGDLAALITALNALPSVETVYVPSPVKNAGTVRPHEGRDTSDFENLQGYLSPAVDGGIDAFHAWTVPGGSGANVKIVDVEGALNPSHEDLPTSFYHDGKQSPVQSDRDHGTAVKGELVAQRNGFGVTGIVYDAEYGFESWYGENIDDQGEPGGNNLEEPLLRAIGLLGAGDILLIEVEITPSVNLTLPCACLPCGNEVALEYEIHNFDAISLATSLGIHVVEAAGNGGRDLSDPAYTDGKGQLFDRSYRDSGATFVAASDPNLGRGVPACFTNYGPRIDLHGWGENVTTTGYGDLSGQDEASFYTATFRGTSSAAPIVAGAVASLQGALLANSTLDPLSSEEIRSLLVETGTPQEKGQRRIGPLPNLRAAFASLLGELQPEIDFQLPSGVSLPTGGTYDFGSVDIDAPTPEAAFEVCNLGSAILSISNGSSVVSGSGYSQVAPLPSSIDPGECSELTVRFEGSSHGLAEGEVIIQNNDLNENPYSVSLAATVNEPHLVTTYTRPDFLPVHFRETSTSFGTDSPPIDFYYLDVDGLFHEQPQTNSGCPVDTNPDILTIRYEGPEVASCTLRGSWDQQEHNCNSVLLTQINAGDDILINTDTYNTMPGDLCTPSTTHHLPYDVPGWMQLTLTTIHGGVHERVSHFVKRNG